MLRLLKKVVISSLLAFLMLSPVYAADSPAATSMILLKDSEIKFHPAPGFPKGAEIVLIRGDLAEAVPYTLRFKLPDGFIILPHWHSTDEQVTVLSGTLNVAKGDTVDKSQATALSAGGYQLVPANAHHYVFATGETIFQLDGMGPRTTTFVNPAEWMALIQKSH
jgi:mannose-6-phosphate isomerase-like protein (cupin superfamily)